MTKHKKTDKPVVSAPVAAKPVTALGRVEGIEAGPSREDTERFLRGTPRILAEAVEFFNNNIGNEAAHHVAMLGGLVSFYRRDAKNHMVFLNHVMNTFPEVKASILAASVQLGRDQNGSIILGVNA